MSSVLPIAVAGLCLIVFVVAGLGHILLGARYQHHALGGIFAAACLLEASSQLAYLTRLLVPEDVSLYNLQKACMVVAHAAVFIGIRTYLGYATMIYAFRRFERKSWGSAIALELLAHSTNVTLFMFPSGIDFMSNGSHITISNFATLESYAFIVPYSVFLFLRMRWRENRGRPLCYDDFKWTRWMTKCFSFRRKPFDYDAVDRQVVDLDQRSDALLARLDVVLSNPGYSSAMVSLAVATAVMYTRVSLRVSLFRDNNLLVKEQPELMSFVLDTLPALVCVLLLLWRSPAAVYGGFDFAEATKLKGLHVLLNAMVPPRDVDIVDMKLAIGEEP
ncbi:uncharacterized protein V1510DRAFT_414919 [Dipodascopsis tothii]|uniref:uncharacterized protein n=1 Tax=Dipodascopsis tothii TaxID=44089 RepID=UPI0034CF6C98